MDDRTSRWRAIAGCAALTLVLAGLSVWGRSQAVPSKRDNEIAAINLLGGVLPTAQSLFREHDLDNDGKLDYADSLKQLVGAGLISADLEDGRSQGYRFELRQGSKAPEFLWIAVAKPTSPGLSGDMHFAVNQAGDVAYRKQEIPLRVDCTLPSNAMKICKCGKGGK